MDYDPAVQERRDGRLTQAFLARYRVIKVKHRLTDWRIAKLAGLSSSYLNNLTRFEKDGLSVSTVRAKPLAAVIERLEAAPEGSDIDALFATTKGEPARVETPKGTGDAELEDALRLFRQRGFSVILIPTAAGPPIFAGQPIVA